MVHLRPTFGRRVGAKNARKGAKNAPWSHPLVAPRRRRGRLSEKCQFRHVGECGAGSTPGPSLRCRGAGGTSPLPLTKLRSSSANQLGGWRGISGAPRYRDEGRAKAPSPPEEFPALPGRRSRCRQFRFAYGVAWIPCPPRTARRHPRAESGRAPRYPPVAPMRALRRKRREREPVRRATQAA